MGTTFPSLEVRNFRLFFVGQIISQVGNWMTLVAQTSGGATPPSPCCSRS